MAAEEGKSAPRFPCKVCGRQFFQESLVVHERICAKAANKKRKIFDSAKQRAEGTELTYKQIKASQKKTANGAVASSISHNMSSSVVTSQRKDLPQPKSNWRAKHEDFINAVRSARGVTLALREGGPLPPPPPPSINPDYIQCPYCSRRFNQSAADRHINFCKEQTQRINPRAPPNAEAKAKQNTRLQYQAPKPKPKNSLVRDITSPEGNNSNSRMTKTSSTGVSRIPGPSGGSRTSVAASPQSRGRASGTYQEQGESTTPVPRTSIPTAHQGGKDHKGGVLVSTGRALRTGRDPLLYQKAKEEAQHTWLSSKTKAVPLSEESLSSALTARVADNTLVSNHISLTDSSLQSANNTTKDHFCNSKHPKQHSSSGKSRFTEAKHNSLEIYDSSCLRKKQAQPNGDYFSKPPITMYSPSKYSTSGKHKPSAKTNVPSVAVSKFCHQCGSHYPVASAKFCCECGTRRLSSS